jgi:hypothetical protein
MIFLSLFFDESLRGFFTLFRDETIVEVFFLGISSSSISIRVGLTVLVDIGTVIFSYY